MARRRVTPVRHAFAHPAATAAPFALPLVPVEVGGHPRDDVPEAQ